MTPEFEQEAGVQGAGCKGERISLANKFPVATRAKWSTARVTFPHFFKWLALSWGTIPI